MATGPGLSDGVYEVMVVDAGRVEVGEPAEGSGDACRLELVVTTGYLKGEVFELTLSGIDLDPIELLGLPGIVEVTNDEPRFLLT